MLIHSKIIMGLATGTLLFSGAPPVRAAQQSHGFDQRYITKISAGDITAGSLATGSADYRHRHRHRVTGDDILTGIGILTGIAILADVVNSAEQRHRRDRAPEHRRDGAPEQRREPVDYPPIASADISTPQGDDIGVAVSACSRAAEHASRNNERVKTIDAVTRNGDAWRVIGQLSGANSTEFDCQTSNGRVDSVKLGAIAT